MHSEHSKTLTTIIAEKTSPYSIKDLLFACRVFADICLVLFREIRRLRKIVQDNNLQAEYSKGD